MVKSNNITADQRTEPKTSHIADPSLIMYMCVYIIIPYLRWPAFVLFQPKVFKQLVNKSYFFHPINNWDYPPDYPVLHSILSRPDQVEIVTADFDRHLCKGKHNNRGLFWGGGTLVFWSLSSKTGYNRKDKMRKQNIKKKKQLFDFNFLPFLLLSSLFGNICPRLSLLKLNSASYF